MGYGNFIIGEIMKKNFIFLTINVILITLLLSFDFKNTYLNIFILVFTIIIDIMWICKLTNKKLKFIKL